MPYNVFIINLLNNYFFMIAHEICEALYALPGGVVEPRRRSIFKPVMFAIIGVVLLIINVVAVYNSDALSMFLIVAGMSLLGYGVVVGVMRMVSDERVPYHTASHRYMRYKESFYDRQQLAALQRAVAMGDESAIAVIEKSDIAVITLVSYSSSDGSIVGYALYEYVDMESRIIGKPTIKA